MKQLNLRLVKQWFDMTLIGVKKHEYRDITPHWISRLVDKNSQQLDENGALSIDTSHEWQDIEFKQFDTAKFTNGFLPTSRSFTIECKGVSIGMGNPEWGAPTDREVFIIEHGAVLEVVNVDFEKEVKKVYPDAELHSNYNMCFDYLFRYWIQSNDTRLCSRNIYKYEAWQSAYFQLLKQGKI